VNKKPRVAFICYDQNNAKYAKLFKASLRKFHSEKDLPLVEISGDSLSERVKKDPQFFYRQKPTIAAELIDEYEVVLGFDVDQIVMGDLSHLWTDTGYDVGTVLNFNREDYKTFGPITTYIIDCTTYMNCGLVVMRSKQFITHWLRLCNTDAIFNNLQYREQDILNMLYYFGDYKVKCFDYKDEFSETQNWHGLVAWGEGLKMKLINKEIILPKSEDGYPNQDVVIKLFHFAHGNVQNKMNYRLLFNEDVIKHLDYLTSEKKK
jgi:hypothetical protein